MGNRRLNSLRRLDGVEKKQVMYSYKYYVQSYACE